MADTTISNLQPGTPSPTDVIPFSTGLTTQKVQVQSLPVDYNSLINKPAVPQAAPTGSIIMWPTATPPTGYIECNGSAVSRTTFSSLFNVLGTTYGSGNGSTTFNLPDLRGQFVRGWANGSSNDPDRASRTNRGDGTTGDNIGTKQVDMFKSHNHSGPGGACCFETAGVVTNYANGNYTPYTTYNTGGSETRPTNVALMYCIKT